MRIQVQETLTVQIQQRKVDVAIQLDFEAQPGDMADVMAAVGQHLTKDAPTAAPVRAPVPSIPAPEPPKKGAYQWRKPELHGRALKTVHRVVKAIADVGGKGLTVSEIVDKARVSNVPVYKMLKPDEPAGEYAKRFLRVTKVGRNQVVDLTSEGRQLASLIRAGKVPT